MFFSLYNNKLTKIDRHHGYTHGTFLHCKAEQSNIIGFAKKKKLNKKHPKKLKILCKYF